MSLRHRPGSFRRHTASGRRTYTRRSSESASSQQGPRDDKEIEELRTVFRLTDHNGDGSITADELTNMLAHKLDISVEQSLLDQLMKSACSQSHGLITERQFIEWFAKLQSLSRDSDRHDPTSDLYAAFKLFDKDGNGFISKDELKKAMEVIDEKMSDSELDVLIKMADSDNDNKINYEDFLKMLL